MVGGYLYVPSVSSNHPTARSGRIPFIKFRSERYLSKAKTNTMLFRQIPQAFTGASSSSNWSICPIPALSQLELRGHAAGQYQIIDVTGRCCAQGQVLENGRLDISALPSGLYTFQLRTTDGHLQVKKFAKL